MSRVKTVLLGVGVWWASALATFAVLAGALAPSKGEQRTRVAFSEFLLEVESGRVQEIRVKGRVATFRVTADGHSVERETVGPLEDKEATLNLRPTDPAAPSPKITWEK
jgi:hypothetical protein